MKKLILICMVIAAMVATAACSVHDPSYDDVTPPKPDLSGIIVYSGLVSDKSGNPLKGAVVKLDAIGEVTTNEEGFYSKEANVVGTFLFTASYTGKISVDREVVVVKKEGSQNIVTNFVLPEAASVTFYNMGSVETEVIEHNGKGVVTISGYVTSPTPTVQFTLAPFYNYKDVEIPTKAATKGEVRVRKPLVGVTLSTSATGNDVVNPTLTMDIFHPLLYEYVSTEKWNGNTWAPVEYTTSEAGMVFANAEPGSYVCSYNVGVEERESVLKLEVNPSVLDNLYGERDTVVTAIVTTYVSGVLVDTYQGEDQCKALLLERLAMDYGLTNLVSKMAISVNITVPKGTALDVKAYQDCLDVIYYLDNADNGVAAKIFGNYEVRASGYNRRHTGGGSLQP